MMFSLGLDITISGIGKECIFGKKKCKLGSLYFPCYAYILCVHRAIGLFKYYLHLNVTIFLFANLT